ncbi:MAG TPA: type II toxin-antitoxin system VapC family toxin [Polyangia bacterium]|nr:type II toxin-antitoxin system VapC family toxin [Polyangia bacterium]
MVEHAPYRAWLTKLVVRPDPFAVAASSLSGFLRVVTNRRIFPVPTPIDQAVGFVRAIRDQPNCVLLAPGERHLELFLDLCLRTKAVAKLVPDAELAALAIENGCDIASADRDFARFPGLRWRHPLDEED